MDSTCIWIYRTLAFKPKTKFVIQSRSRCQGKSREYRGKKFQKQIPAWLYILKIFDIYNLKALMLTWLTLVSDFSISSFFITNLTIFSENWSKFELFSCLFHVLTVITRNRNPKWKIDDLHDPSLNPI